MPSCANRLERTPASEMPDSQTDQCGRHGELTSAIGPSKAQLRRLLPVPGENGGLSVRGHFERKVSTFLESDILTSLCRHFHQGISGSSSGDAPDHGAGSTASGVTYA